MAIDNYKGKKFCDEKVIDVDDCLTVEQALQIKINNKSFTITMRTPGNDKELVRGLLYSEDVFKDINQDFKLKFTEDIEKAITIANVIIPENKLGNGYLNSRNLLSVSSCGICGKTELEDIDSSKQLLDRDLINTPALYQMFEVMQKNQSTFHQSGGSHAAAAFTKEGKVLSIKEDIGRHNAVDKVIGDLILSNQLKQATCLIVSGRISYEIVSKAFAAKIPILAAVSAPSTLAVDFAKELGVTLLGFCRNNKATCYSLPYRIKLP